MTTEGVEGRKHPSAPTFGARLRYVRLQMTADRLALPVAHMLPTMDPHHLLCSALYSLLALCPRSIIDICPCAITHFH